MADIDRVRVALTGFPGAPGVSTFYTTDPAAFRAALSTYYTAMENYFPNDVVWSIEGTGDIIDATSGSLTGTWTDAPAYGGTGSGGTGSYAAPAGICVNWLTGTVLDRHRLRGRTFFVPVAFPVFASDGSIENSNLTTIRALSTTFVTAVAGIFVVWHRPRVASDGPPPVTARAGGFAIVIASMVKDKVAILRSRRD